MKFRWTLAAFALAFVHSPLLAQHNPGGSETRIVRIAGLDLTRSEDIRILDHRIDHAIAEACGYGSAADGERVRHMVECRRTVRAQIDDQRVRAIAAANRNSDSRLATLQPVKSKTIAVTAAATTFSNH